MKKLLALILCAGVLAGCGASSKTYSVGVASVTSMKLADATAEKEGQVQANTTYASVVLDKDGKIVDVAIDVAQNSGKFNTAGEVTTDAAAATPTKREKGDDYGMKKASAIGKEWFEQADALEAWMIGKTIDEVKNLERDEAGVPTTEDLTSSVTIKTNDYINAVVAAAENAVEVKGVAKVGTTSETSLKMAAATAEKEGSIQANTTFGVVAYDKDGKVLMANIDVAQNTGKFDAAGVITSDAAAATPTKKEKGDDYGMKKASAIGKEWFEQIAAFEAYMVGKTNEEIQAIELVDNVATSEDLTSSVTIKLNSYMSFEAKAFEGAVEVK